MERGWTLLSVGTGAGLMYLFDPDRGRRRRALARDKFVRFRNEARRSLSLASRDLVNRSRGVFADVRHRIEGGEAPDDVLSERVRARIGHCVSHPHAVHVDCTDGHVVLRGPVLADEVEDLIADIEAIPGIESVANELDVHEEGDIPALQGERGGTLPRLRQTPASQLLTAACGLACSLYGGRRGGISGFAIRGLGVALLLADLAGTQTFHDLVEGGITRTTSYATPETE